MFKVYSPGRQSVSGTSIIALRTGKLPLSVLRLSIQKSMEVIEFIGESWFMWR
jgi:hypothetical protein